MQKSPRQSWHRMLLASIAVLTIAAAGMSFAGPGATYQPEYGTIIGNATPPVGTGSAYSLYVEYTNGTNATVGSANGVVWGENAGAGTWSGDSFTPALADSGHRIELTASFSLNGAAVNCSRIVSPM